MYTIAYINNVGIESKIWKILLMENQDENIKPQIYIQNKKMK